MKKTWFLLLVMALCLGLFTACASNADTVPSPSPTMMTSPSAEPTETATSTPAATAAPTAASGVNTVEDALRVSEEVKQEVEKLSELDTADAVAANNIALVGVSYDAQYQGGLTERLISMIESRVMAMDKTITAVHVTDDEALSEDIKTLYEDLKADKLTFDQLQTQMLTISGQIAGGTAATSPTGTAGSTVEPQATTGM